MTATAITAVLGGRKVLKRDVTSETELRVMTREGLPVKTLSTLAEELKVERKTLAKVVGISERTLSRRIASGSKLSAEESDRTMRVARVYARAVDVFGDSEKAARWMKKANRVMEGESPLSLLDTDAGVTWVETILGRIDYGIYS
ncbi:MAG: antitoxin Xre/MbcA/ParS toxin-binding domain-containing protein [Acidobacteriota bacterium]